MPVPRLHPDTPDQQEAGLTEGYGDTEDAWGSGHVSGPWDGDELALLEGSDGAVEEE